MISVLRLFTSLDVNMKIVLIIGEAGLQAILLNFDCLQWCFNILERNHHFADEHFHFSTLIKEKYCSHLFTHTQNE